MDNLDLIPIDDLIEAVERRCKEFICAYTPNEFQRDKELKFYYGKGSWQRSCCLSNVLNNDVLNNWNGELRRLQRINEEGSDEKEDS